ncbi:unnamed protein product [Sphenostylis stenocarpa]|uniref:C2H2-type domain-containing protein n=1 Tax=Sphenostylis stenocarpa TaxID=92480 RepID=A0AA86SMT5_9FABA|nr:unnamed protein product [Sphenostylis stenocarpa]
MENTLAAESSNNEAETNHGKVSGAAPDMPPTMKKEFFCRYCDKKFSNYQALGGHHYAHKVQRAATQNGKFLSMVSDYYSKYSYVGGKTLGVSLLSMTRFKPHHHIWPHMELKRDYYHNHVPWSGHHTFNHVQPTMHQFHNFMAKGSDGSHQHHRSHQPLISPTVAEGPSQPHLSHPCLCHEGNFGPTSNSSVIPQNSGQENNSCPISMPENGAVEKLDLTLKI